MDLKAMTVQELNQYLTEKGVSDESTQRLAANMVSGQALLLVDKDELKELLPIIGDRALVRDILAKYKVDDKEPTGDHKKPPKITINDTDSNEDSDNSDESENEQQHAQLNSRTTQSGYGSGEACVVDESESDLIMKPQDSNEDSYHHSLASTSDEPSAKKFKADSQPVVNKRTSVVKLRGHEPPLPNPFELPRNFPQDISVALSNKKIAGKIRAKFITIVTQTIFRFKSYPTDDEYKRVVRYLVKKWPFLDEGEGITPLVVSIKMRMAYLRKPADMKRGNPVKKKRRVQSVDKARMPSAPVVSPLPCGEDSASLQRHSKMLKTEMKKVTPNKEIIQKLMQKTYVSRREEILEGMGTVQDIIRSYPALTNSAEIIREFCRIMDKQQLEEEIVHTWDSLVPRILDYAKDFETTGLSQFLAAYTQDEVSDDYRMILALGSLVYMVPDVRTKVTHTNVVTILQDSANITSEATEVATSQPCIVARCDGGQVKDSFLIIEKQMICKVETRRALLVLFSSFYVFNVHYPNGCSNFYLFLESVFLKKKVVGRKPRLFSILAQLTLAPEV